MEVKATYDGYSYRKGYDSREVEYDIGAFAVCGDFLADALVVLETLVLGAPSGALKLALIAIVLIAAILCVLRFSNITSTLGFLTRGETKKE